MADTNDTTNDMPEEEDPERAELEEKLFRILQTEEGIAKVLVSTVDDLYNRNKELDAAKEETASLKRKYDQAIIDLNKANEENRDNNTFKRKYDQTIIDLNKATQENQDNGALLAACRLENESLKTECINLKAEIANKNNNETSSKKAKSSNSWFPNWN